MNAAPGTPPIRIEPLDAHGAPLRALLEASDRYLGALYPAASNHLESPDGLALPSVYLLGAYVGAELAGCGAAKRVGTDERYGEIKRLFVHPAWRGQGLARRLMQALEAHLVDQGIALARLETGIHQPEALGLYAALDYAQRGPFGDYRADPLSVFFEKRLAD